jgi:hypothetical protein
MSKYEVEKILSAIRSATSSAIGHERAKVCTAIDVFDQCLTAIQEENEADILFQLGYIQPKGDKCKGCDGCGEIRFD